MCLESILCSKHRRRVARDNTVRYRWRTLQLLPGTDRPSYAGAVVNVLEGPDRRLEVQHEERIIPSQEAPPRPSVLRGFVGRTVHTPIPHLPSNGLGRKWVARLATLDAEASHDTADRNGAGRVRKAATQRRRKPGSTPTPTLVGPVAEVFNRLISELIIDWDVPGASLAITKDGRLILAKGYGLTNMENQKLVQPDTLFRIASISKPITAVAVLQLVEDGLLNLDDRVFQILDRFQPPEGVHKDPRLDDIAVRHLLQPSGGWDRGRSYDPMFSTGKVEDELGVPKPASCRDVVRFMLGQPLDFDPGTGYAYSNFGYCLLGRVIEEKTGQPYEEYVKERVLAPIGISRMHIGGTLPKDRADREATYYGFPGQELADSAMPDTPQRVPWHDGGFHLRTIDAHGGWVASAIDLVRFATSVEGNSPPQVLSPQSVQTMVARPDLALWQDSSYHYGMGWLVRPVGNDSNWWHDGSLPGTYALVVRSHEGFAWAFLVNSRPEEWPKFGQEVDRLIWQGICEVTAWPSHDLFHRPLQPGPIAVWTCPLVALPFMVSASPLRITLLYEIISYGVRFFKSIYLAVFQHGCATEPSTINAAENAAQPESQKVGNLEAAL